jgi:hypothetical protein
MGWEGPVTYRQLRAWDWWKVDTFSEQDLVCKYLMQLTQYVHGTWAKKVKPIDGYQLNFKVTTAEINQEARRPTPTRTMYGDDGKDTTQPLPPRKIVQMNADKNRWFAAVGYKPTPPQ